MLQLKEFIYSILRHWRRFLIFTIILLVLGGGLYTAKNTLARKNNKVDLNKVVYSGKDWEGAEDYYIAKLKYVGVGNDVLEKQAVIDAYSAHLYGSQFKNHLIENCFDGKETPYFISNILSISTGGLENCMVVECIYIEEEKCNDIANVIKVYIEQLYPSMQSGLGEHKLFLVDFTVDKGFEVSSDKRFEQTRAAMIESNIDTTVSFSKKLFVIYAFLFAIIGDFLLAIWILLSDSINDRIYNITQISDKTGIPLLGDFSFTNLKTKLDRFLFKLFIKRNNFSAEGNAKIISRKLDPDTRYIMAGNVKNEKLLEIKQLIENKSSQDFNISCKTIDTNENSLLNWNSEEKVIFVAKRFKDNAQDIRDLFEIYSSLEVEIAGVLFI